MENRRPTLVALANMVISDRSALMYEGFKLGIALPLSESPVLQRYFGGEFAQMMIIPGLSAGYRKDQEFDVFDLANVDGVITHVIGMGRDSFYPDRGSAGRSHTRLCVDMARLSDFSSRMERPIFPEEKAGYGFGIFTTQKVPLFVREKVHAEKGIGKLELADFQRNSDLFHQLDELRRFIRMMGTADEPFYPNIGDENNIVIDQDGNLKVVNPQPLFNIDIDPNSGQLVRSSERSSGLKTVTMIDDFLLKFKTYRPNGI